MATDRYPAVRHLAWRSARRLMAPGAPVGIARSAVDRLRASVGTAEVPSPGWLTEMSGQGPERDLEIGE
jgi:hypothetical protein